jgi:hypothetical protein
VWWRRRPRGSWTSGSEWSSELELLRQHVTLRPGLTPDELERAEQVHGFRFPPDLRSLLSCALPSGPRFPDWRKPESRALRDQMTLPFQGIAFDIERNAFWWPAWGPRPAALGDALAVARAAVEAAPRLIPVFAHRYLPAEPEDAGNPVFSVHQTDIIHYGADLRSYLANEFGTPDPTIVIVGGTPRRIRLWTDLVEANSLRMVRKR